MFECQYCETRFLTEEKFSDHTCRQKERTMELNTPVGQAAFNYYVLWFKKRMLITPSKEAFVVSKYYTAFFKFIEFSKKMGIPDIELYIELMSSETIQPSHWYNDDIYKFFINYLDNDCSPLVHVRITLLTLEKLSSSFDCNMNEVFDHLHGADVANLIQSRNLSPWILLFSKKFRVYLQNNTNPDEVRLIEKAISINTWKILMESKRNHIPDIKKYIDQLDL